MSIKYYSKEV
ncbi:uncharacterized protein FTOL_13992 [Fusarium torulosum]|uniref:Uncharacterized protein n=1 Tax=Fusarium torulosum TaxID=33205 RepID=A0AAE8MP70_9HYPO|nr:uncharacterized protein FTOL_13992 [Fusarium torulosum]